MCDFVLESTLVGPGLLEETTRPRNLCKAPAGVSRLLEMIIELNEALEPIRIGGSKLD